MCVCEREFVCVCVRSVCVCVSVGERERVCVCVGIVGYVGESVYVFAFEREFVSVCIFE